MSQRQYRTPHDADFLPDRRYFTAAEANRALVLVKRIAADVVRLYAELGDLQEVLDACPQEHSETVRRDLLATIERLQGCLEELDDVGVELVDWSRGIVNFPSVADGRCVYLCWEHGQDAVGSWHEADEGFAQRQPLETLPAETTAALA